MQVARAAMRASVMAAVVATATHCSDDLVPAPLVEVPPPSDDPAGCAPGEMPLDDAGCRSAGVPVDACASGFVPDGDGGCLAVQPEGACPDGQVAWLGETGCHPVADCGSSPWGDAPIDAETQFVDSAYAGADSDGTEGHPWKTIGEAIDATMPGGLVAITDGEYAENIFVDQPITLWGRCPDKVTITGTNSLAAVAVTSGGSGARLHGLALTGAAAGVHVTRAKNVEIDDVWIHDVAHEGIFLKPTLDPSSVHVREVLVERATSYGVVVWASDGTFERLAVRDIAPFPDGSQGGGVAVIGDSTTELRAHAEITASIIERTRQNGLVVDGGDLAISSSLVRDTTPSIVDGTGVLAIEGGFIATVPGWEPPSLSVSQSVIERSHTSAIGVFGADAVVDATTIRDTRSGAMFPGMPPREGVGVISGIGAVENKGATVVIASTRILGSTMAGILVGASVARIEGTRVSGTTAPEGEDVGAGLWIFGAEGTPAEVDVVGSRIEENVGFGIYGMCANARVSGTLIRATTPSPEGAQHAGKIGEGIASSTVGCTPRASLTVTSSLIEDVYDVGVLIVDSDAIIDSTTIRGTKPRAFGDFGDGLLVIHHAAPASVRVTRSRIEHNARAGILNVSASVELGTSIFECNRMDLDGEDLGQGAFIFDNLGGNACGCEGSPATCIARSAKLTPPEAPEGTPP